MDETIGADAAAAGAFEWISFAILLDFGDEFAVWIQYFDFMVIEVADIDPALLIHVDIIDTFEMDLVGRPDFVKGDGR